MNEKERALIEEVILFLQVHYREEIKTPNKNELVLCFPPCNVLDLINRLQTAVGVPESLHSQWRESERGRGLQIEVNENEILKLSKPRS